MIRCSAPVRAWNLVVSEFCQRIASYKKYLILSSKYRTTVTLMLILTRHSCMKWTCQAIARYNKYLMLSSQCRAMVTGLLLIVTRHSGIECSCLWIQSNSYSLPGISNIIIRMSRIVTTLLLIVTRHSCMECSCIWILWNSCPL